MAKAQLVRQYVGRIRNDSGKRVFLATKQTSLWGGDRHVYCLASEVATKQRQQEHTLAWMHKHMAGLVKRFTLLPDWATDRILNVIDEVFSQLKKAA